MSQSTGPDDTAEAPGYELTFAPDDTSWTARENLNDILIRELLGPADGDTEQISVPPDTRYLLGRIAPTKLTGGDAPASAADGSVTDRDDNDSTLDLGDDLDARESRGVPVIDNDDSGIDGEEDAIAGDHDEPIKRGIMIPASMGLRFQVPFDLREVTVRAGWGTYEPRATGEVSAAGRPVRHFVRTPVHRSARIDLTAQRPGHTTDIPLVDDVVLRVDTYDDQQLRRRLVEVALCNDRETPTQIPVDAWMFQTKLDVEADGADVFLPVVDVMENDPGEDDDELRRLGLQYRDRLEFAVGRTCSADWVVADGARRATKVSTTWLPTAETPQTRAFEVPGTVLDMRRLAEMSAAEVGDALRPIVDGYASWLGLDGAQPPPDGRPTQRAIAEALPRHLSEEAHLAIDEATQVHRQLVEGLDHLVSDPEALRCFAFMNRVMADQRVHSQVAALRADRPELSADAAMREVLHGTADKPRKPGDAHSWRTFQIAFVLMQIPAMCDPAHPRRSGPAANVELLFFPTGGGKTEAYLGLAAFTFAIRRRQGMLDTPDGTLNGGDGVAVLMRYTLRLLTAQQFQRATTLICAAELARLEDTATWGDTPFRIGLWVGSGVSPKWVKDAAEELQLANKNPRYRLTVLQIQRCPWCGTRIGSGEVKIDTSEGRVRVYCGDDLSDCPFSEGGDFDDGLPVLTVDEEIYRLTPAFVIATVDKFARLAREGQAASLFGHVRLRCDRHGYVHPDDQGCTIAQNGKHPKSGALPAAPVYPTSRLRPPDLIIQDELHLITGALGTTVGLFEVAIDALTTWRSPAGATVKPLIVASTATVRNALDQVHALYGRGVTVFPPQVTDVADTFFSREVAASPTTPGRRYVGISTTGVRMTTAEIRIAEVLMAGAQELIDTSGAAADPYCTLVGYFNATRELAGMARYMRDDIQTALAKGRRWSRLPQRAGTGFRQLNLAELTSRVAGADITSTLDQMAVTFDTDFDTTAARRQRIQARQQGHTPPSRDGSPPFDAVLATSMLQVGVDVTRLGLMLLVGQPKNTAEYIQASSRVGRDASRPGLVVTLGNWARPRDLAHYEQFRHYHETFYAQVEPLSVTPFSVTALERGLDGVLVSAARVLHAAVDGGLSPEKNAGRISEQRPFVENLIDALVARVNDAADEPSTETARQRLLNRLDQWEKRRTSVIQRGFSLAYERVGDASTFAPLMRSAENVRSRDDALENAPFIVANSMREVQPEINLLVSPIPERLFYEEPMSAPEWHTPAEETS
ncbi:MAG: DISARM system helicase DrmA [Dermatophilus congolensis]|nr:DISARM system helicase DrmA [Dermatophilus congolensis]